MLRRLLFFCKRFFCERFLCARLHYDGLLRDGLRLSIRRLEARQGNTCLVVSLSCGFTDPLPRRSWIGRHTLAVVIHVAKNILRLGIPLVCEWLQYS